MPLTAAHSIMFIAGDPSGDEHAAPVMLRLAAMLSGTTFFGIGGPRMVAAGLMPLLPFARFNRMGLVEVLGHLSFFIKAKNRCIDEMRRRRPAALVLVDYPGFNLSLLKAGHKLGIPVVWYIAPKVWAWKKGRAKILGRNAAAIAAIFPFETPLYASFPAPVTYVGNPLIEALQTEAVQRGHILPQCRKWQPHTAAQPWRIALVPGSRDQEITRILEPMAGAMNLLAKQLPITVRVSRCPWLPEKLFGPTAGTQPTELFSGPLYDLLAWADVALVTSGTATLQAALMGVPHVIVYRTATINYAAAKLVVKIPHIGLPNIIVGKKIVPECIQDQATPQILADHLSHYLNMGAYFDHTCRELAGLWDILGTKQPSHEVAAMIAKCVRERPQR
jgi:lipid-A-disaccharide synthase